eukprot:gene24693-29838_t
MTDVEGLRWRELGKVVRTVSDAEHDRNLAALKKKSAEALRQLRHLANSLVKTRFGDLGQHAQGLNEVAAEMEEAIKFFGLFADAHRQLLERVCKFVAPVSTGKKQQASSVAAPVLPVRAPATPRSFMAKPEGEKRKVARKKGNASLTDRPLWK